MTVFETIKHWKISQAWQYDIKTDGQDFFETVVLLICLKVGYCGGKW